MLELIIEGLLPIIGFCAGMVMARRGDKVPEVIEPADPKPICGCGHHYSLHDDENGCSNVTSEQVLVERGQPHTVMTGMYGQNAKVVYEHERWETREKKCSCKRYTGPEPLPTYIA